MYWCAINPIISYFRAFSKKNLLAELLFFFHSQLIAFLANIQMSWLFYMQGISISLLSPVETVELLLFLLFCTCRCGDKWFSYTDFSTDNCSHWLKFYRGFPRLVWTIHARKNKALYKLCPSNALRRTLERGSFALCIYYVVYSS